MKVVLYRTLRGVVLSNALLSGGCQLGIDADLIKDAGPNANDPDGGHGQCPPGFVCKPDPGTPRNDAGPLHDGGSEDDGGPEVDAGQMGDAGGAGPQCVADSDCQANEYCSADSTCHAACNPVSGCVLLNTGRVSVQGLLRDGDAIYWSMAADRDALDNSLNNGAIWRLDENGGSSSVLGGLQSPRLMKAIDSKLYYLDWGALGPADLYRVAESGGAADKIVLPGDLPIAAVVASDSYLWFKSQSSDRYADIWRAPRASGTPLTKVRSLENAFSEPGLLGARDDMFIFAGFYGLERHDLSAAEPTILSIPTIHGFLSGDRVIGLTSSGMASVENLTTGAHKTLVAVNGSASLSHWLLHTDLLDEWLIWTIWKEDASDSGNQSIVIGRTHLDLAVPSETLAEITAHDAEIPNGEFGEQNPLIVMGPWADEVICYNPIERRLFRRDIPAFSCASAIPCSDAYACQPDHTCQRVD